MPKNKVNSLKKGEEKKLNPVTDEENEHWYPISYYWEEEKKLKDKVAPHPINSKPKEEKLFDEMQHQVGKLREDMSEYFSGKQHRFDNRTGFFQCVIDPSELGGYIAVQ